MIGELVIHYRILAKIGEGGMGVVYRAEDTRLGRQVAVKFLSARLSSEPAAIDRFQREARAASSLNHPHICAIYDVGQHGDRPFLVMELLDGMTLRSCIGKSALSMVTALDFAVQIVDAVEAAHRLGIVHRDIKSANLFVTDSDAIKILDFGLAKLTRPELFVSPHSPTIASPGSSTSSGQILGTLTSLSPEQARGEELDTRTDLFSIGVVLFEMVTGREPFSARTPALVLDAVLHGTPPPASALNREVPQSLDAIIAKALQKSRSARYQTAAELNADLHRVRREMEAASATTSAGSGSLLQAAPASTRRRWLLAAGLGALALLISGTLVTYSLVGGTSTLDSIESVAVLPFAAGGTGADTEYLTDGISESLINGLARLPDLRVTSRSVAFKYKNKVEDTQKIGRDLNVLAIVTGRVTIRGDRLVIQAELMNVADGSQLWGDQYNRPASDLLAVQDEIANAILERIRPRLSGEDKTLVTKRSTENAAAYQEYLGGRFHLNQGTIAGYRRAIDHFQQAIARDSKYAQAYAGLADAQLQLGSYWVEAITEAKSAAVEALRLDPDLAEAHVALGHIKLLLDWDWPAAEREFQRGISLAPASALAHNQFAGYLATVGRLDEAIASSRRALQIDPLSPIANSDLGSYLLYAGRPQEAIAQFRKTLDSDPNSMSARRGLGIALGQERQHDEAIRELQRALDLSEGSPVVLGHLGAVYAAAGRKTDAEGVLQRLDAQAARQYVPASAVAMVHLALGDRPRALDLLQKAYDEHDFAMAQIRIVPWFAALRDDERFRKLTERFGR